MRKNTKWLGFLLILTLASEGAAAGRKPASGGRPEMEHLKRAQSLVAEDKSDEAARLLNEKVTAETDREKRALTRLALGLILFNQGKDAEAEVQFKQSIEDGSRVPDYVSFYLGLINKRFGRFQAARADFDKVMSSSAPPATQADARFQSMESAISEGNWKIAHTHLQVLRKKMKNSQLYPTILFELMRAERKLGKRGNACKSARELFAKYPTTLQVRDWDLRLETNVVDGEKLGCLATDNDLRTRIRRLQWGGEAERASKELKALQERSGEAGNYSVDSLLANHLINEGHVDEAMKLLLKHYESQKNRPPYLMLLGKASSRAGEFQAAIGAYTRAYELAPRARNSSNALFQAAFTSYQIQDYDGATRRFEQFVKAYPGSKLARDSRWHLAWIRYLRGDYSGAYESFNKLAKAPKQTVRRGRRRVVKTDAISAERIRYWSAMSLLKMGKTQDAVPLFQALVRDPAISYYSISAYQRLVLIPGAKVPPGVEVRLGLKKAIEGGAAPTEEELKQAAEAMQDEKEEFENQAAVAVADGSEGDDEAEGNGEEAPVAEEETAVAGAGEEKSFNDPGMARRFERARDLFAVGLEDSARRELSEVEKRARSAADRRLLLAEYEQVRNYYRSSYMGEVGFGGTRLKDGLRGEGKLFWEYAYPRAFEPTVAEASKSTSVPEELIWGIMRAESHFYQDAQSAVGALGLMQIMPFTGRQVANLMSLNGFESRSLLVPETNIRLGSRYLQRLLEKFSGSVPLVAASYNAGPHRAHAWVKNFGSLDMDEFIEHIPFVETRNYVKKVVRNYQIYNLLYSSGSKSLGWLVRPVGIQVDEKIPTREIW